MLLCLDVGNSHIYGGVFAGDAITLRFRFDSGQTTSDEIGIFLRSVLRENGVDPGDISAIAICSVVPQLDYSLRSACIKYFDCEAFMLQPGVKTGLQIKYQNPLEVGSDRIANAIAAMAQFPNQPLIIMDFGTAITFCAVSAKREYCGGVIIPGVRLAMESLQAKTAKLPIVEIIKPEAINGRSTITSIQSGLYHGTVGACREIIQKLQKEQFSEQPALTIATGGFATLFEDEGLFTIQAPDLVLQGLRIANSLNSQ